MKRILAFLLVLLLLPVFALANSWGLKGDLLTAVERDQTWNDYTTISDQVGSVAVMGSRYHNALMLVMEKGAPLQVHTRAVWQPDDDCGPVRLARSEDGFTFSYKELGDSYRFELRDGQYLLTEAQSGELRFALQANDPSCYSVTDGSRTTLWYSGYNGLSLALFNIRLLPRSMGELTQLRHMRTALDSGSDILGWYEDAQHPGRLYTPNKTGTVPVYGAPSTKAWRAGKGKAAVSLKGEIWVLREWIGEDGEVWLHIRYEVSQRTHRFGFIKASQLPGYQVVGCETYPQLRVPVRAASAAFLTDDPLLSQYAQTTLFPGDELICLGVFNDEYALVETEIGGKAAWLFAPLMALEPVTEDVCQDVMAQLEGCWFFHAGGNMSSDYLQFHADGTFCDPSFPENHGVFTITAYDPAQGKYWNDPPYELTLRYADGRVNVCGLALNQTEYDMYDPETDTVKWEMRDAFSLTNWEGGGGYVRINEEDVPLWEHEDGNG